MNSRYLTWIDGEEATVEILDDQGGAIRARLEFEEGEPREVSFQRLDDGDASGAFQLTMNDGRSVVGRLVSAAKGTRVLTTGEHRLEVQAISERDAWMGDGAMGQDSGEVTVSMPGKVIKALVAIGDEVEQGQPVLIIEAMKMENEVKAGRAGVVSAIHVEAGQSVEADVVLMEVGDG